MFTAFYSDPHFGHWTSESRNIIKYADRPFRNTLEMKVCLIHRYNEVIKENDYVLWLGDVTFLPFDPTKEIIDKLNGKKALVKGNHDKRSARWFMQLGFSLVFDHPIHLLINGISTRANHYPYIHNTDKKYRDKCPNYHKGEILLHGHTHSKIKKVNNQIHVGVDAWDYYPVTLKQIEDLLLNEKV